MSLALGRTYLAIPGPSVMPDQVLQAMHRPSPNIYEGELVELTQSVIADLKYVARTKHHVAIYIANGHGVWEAALANIAEPGDRLLQIATGAFGHGWADMVRSMGIEVDVLDFGRNSTYDPEAVREALQNHNYKAVLTTHVDTSTSIKNDIAQVRRILDETGSEALLAVDCIASLGCDHFEMDDWGVDVMVAACQKGLMVPAGVGFVFCNETARQRRHTLNRVSSYWDWEPRIAPDLYFQHFCGTAPTHHIYGLRAALDLIKDEGIEQVWRRHEILAHALWAAIDVWSHTGAMALNVADPALRSHAVTAASLGAPHGTNLRRWAETKAGLTLGIGLGMATEEDPRADGFIRFGHMGHLNAQMMLAAIATTQAGLMAIGAPLASGAVDAAAQIIAQNA